MLALQPQYLRCGTVCDVPPHAPHLLELDTDLIESLGDDGNEHILHEPCQEENHGAKVKGRSPARKAVDGTIHDEHPAFL